VTRTAAKAPARRTVNARVAAGEFEGWEATAHVDFPARILADLQSGSLDRVLPALDRIVTEHNMPDEDGKVAETMADVVPYDGMLAVAKELLEAMQSLPPR